MRDPTSPVLDSAIFQSNLAALRSVDPVLAASLESTPLPAGARPARTRDGQVSYVWGDPAAPQWLGGTTVPRSRARGLIDGFQTGEGNALFVGVGAGLEAAEFLARSAPTTALFIIESDRAVLGMTLRTTSLSAPIAAQQLVLVSAEDGWRQLRDFLLEHSGFLAPNRVLAWPWLTRDQHHDVAARLTALAVDISAARDAELTRLQNSHISRDGNAVAVISLSAEPIDTHSAAGIAWGIEQLGRPAAIFSANAPARMHPAALAQFLANPTLAEIVLLNATPCDLRDLIPPELPATTWLTPNASIPADIAQRIGRANRIVVSTAAQRGGIENSGINQLNVILAPPAAHPTETTRRKHLLVLASPADDRPESVGLHLTSHVTLWNAAREILAAKSEQIWSEDIPDVLAQAEVRGGVHISDATVRQGILDRIRNALAPALLRNAFIEALRAAEIDFDFVPTGRLPNPAIAYTYVIHLALSAEPTSEFLDAIANGARPIVRTRQGRIPSDFSPFFPIAAATSISSADALVDSVRGNPGDFVARDHVLRHHTWRDRLRGLFKTPA